MSSGLGGDYVATFTFVLEYAEPLAARFVQAFHLRQSCKYVLKKSESNKVSDERIGHERKWKHLRSDRA